MTQGILEWVVERASFDRALLEDVSAAGIRLSIASPARRARRDAVERHVGDVALLRHAAAVIAGDVRHDGGGADMVAGILHQQPRAVRRPGWTSKKQR